LSGIALGPDVDAGAEAFICAIDDLQESYSNQCIDAQNLRYGLEAMKAGREGERQRKGWLMSIVKGCET
jgi:hypothetical protein